MKKTRKGIALISVLLIMVVLFIISTGFLQLITRDAQAGMTQYQSDLCMMLADSGIEYGLFMIRHNCFMRSTGDYENVLISQLSYDNGLSGDPGVDAQWLKARGIFRLTKMSEPYLDGGYYKIPLKSVGEIQRTDGVVLQRRTVFAVVYTGKSSEDFSIAEIGTLRVDTWYEQWR